MFREGTVPAGPAAHLRTRVPVRELVLFDIDGTLLSGGPARGAFETALLEVFGTAGPIDGWEFSGKTDPQIARELLGAAGLSSEAIDEGLPSLWDRYLGEMEARLPGDPPVALPGVGVVLDRLEVLGDVAVGLLTGNVFQGAHLKLAAVGLGSRFAVGAFGSDREVRNELPEVAVGRAAAHWGVTFAPEQVVIVGDTPRDVECGRGYGTRTVAVATGRFRPDELRSAGADVVLGDMGAPVQVLEAILDGSRANRRTRPGG